MSQRTLNVVFGIVLATILIGFGWLIFGQPWDRTDQVLTARQQEIVNSMAATAQAAVNDSREASSEAQNALEKAEEIVGFYQQQLRELRLEYGELQESGQTIDQELVELRQELSQAQGELAAAERALSALGVTPEPVPTTAGTDTVATPQPGTEVGDDATPPAPSEGSLRGSGLRIGIVEDDAGSCSPRDIPLLGRVSCSQELKTLLEEELPGADVRIFPTCGSGFSNSQWDAAVYDLQIGSDVNAGPSCAQGADIPVEVAWFTPNAPQSAQSLFGGVITDAMRVRTKGENGSAADVVALIISGLQEEGLLPPP